MIRGRDHLEEQDVDETLQLRCILLNNFVCVCVCVDGLRSLKTEFSDGVTYIT
jgi:hypothetical protein